MTLNRILAAGAAGMAAGALVIAILAFATAISNRPTRLADWEAPLVRAPEKPHIRRPH